MEIFRFVKWWFRQLDDQELSLLFVGTVILLFVPLMIIFGVKGLLFGLAAIFSVLLLSLVYAVIMAIKQKWYEYKEHKEQEAQKIVDRLKGQELSDADREKFNRITNILSKIKKP